METLGVGGLFCGWVTTGAGVESLSKQGFEGPPAPFSEGTREGGDGGVVLCCWTILSVTVSIGFSGVGATGMCLWQIVRSAVWRMTLVAMALQAGNWREGVFSAARAVWLGPDPRHCDGGGGLALD